MREVRTRDRPGRGCREKMIVEEAPRPAGPYSHAVVTYYFVFVAHLKGRRALRRARFSMPSTTKFVSP